MNILLAMFLAQAHNLNDPFVAPSSSPALGIFSSQKVSQEVPLESLTFQYGINTELVSTAVSDGGTITQANSSAILTTGALDGGYAGLVARRVTRYVPGQGIRLRFTAVFSPCAAQSTQEIGLGNEDDDFLGFGCVGATFGMIHRAGGVQTFVPKSQWNGAPITFDHTKGNIYSIAYQWLGYGVMRGVMERNDGTFVTVHTFKFPNTRTTPTFANPALRFMARAFNWGSTTSKVVSVPSVGIVVEGMPANGAVHRGLINRRSVSTTPVPVFVIRNEAQWDGGSTNMVRLHIQDIHVSGTGAADVNCGLYENAGHTSTWSNVAYGLSPASYDLAPGAWDGGGTLRHAWVFEGSSGGTSEDLGTIFIDPGNTMSVICYSVTGNSTTGVGFNWLEEF